MNLISKPIQHNLFLGIWINLSSKRKLQICLLAFFMFFSGFAELISLSLVIPFLAILTDPQKIFEFPLLGTLAKSFNLNDPSTLIIPAAFLFAISALVASAIRLINLKAIVQVSATVGSELSCKAFKVTLLQPYALHLQKSSSATISEITTQVDLTVGAINSFLQLLTALVVSVGILSALFIVEPYVASISFTVFGLTYLLIAAVTKKRIIYNGQEIVRLGKHQIRLIQEGLGSIRDVLLCSTQKVYIDSYKLADQPLRISRAENIFLGAAPRFVFEALGMILISSLGTILFVQKYETTLIIPLLGAFALGAQRLLPSLQQIYSSWTALRGYAPAVTGVIQILNQPIPPKPILNNKWSFDDKLTFENVDFQYLGCKKTILTDINFHIKRGECIGIIGPTGSGKTTLGDILMGLLEPTNGTIYADTTDLCKNQLLADWGSIISHVPQRLHLIDSSISENIAFGVPFEQIDMERVKYVSNLACLHEYIDSTSSKYNTIVGERGILLSGGQCQRIAIARALYRNSKILFLDEATSALDNGTEQRIISSILDIERITVVMIAHRLTTLRSCDRILKLEDGKIIAQGPPKILLNEFF